MMRDSSETIERRLEAAIAELERKSRHGGSCDLHSLLEKYDLTVHPFSAVELIYAAFRMNRNLGQPVTPEAYLLRFPEYASRLERLLMVDQIFDQEMDGQSTDQTRDIEQSLASTNFTSGHELNTGEVHPREYELRAREVPETLGRYQIQRLVGEGAFGRVWLAFDPILHREVAIKEPKLSEPTDTAKTGSYLDEARRVAQLDHPHIVPVWDVGQCNEGRPFVVSKFIDGVSLKGLLENGPVTIGETLKIVAAIADALHYAHTQGVIHRDVKPANVLISQQGTPFLADFGLALLVREQAQLRGEVSGSPAYMSPEQVRGHSHRLDGRTDIWSLGVILYEMLTGQRPFIGQTIESLFEEITNREPRPPRQIFDTIPQGVEAICLKALSKNISERYTTGMDLRHDLMDVQSRAIHIDANLRLPEKSVDKVRLRIHVACFFGSPELYLFLNITNVSPDTDIVVTHVWLQTEPTVHALNAERPLPVRIHAYDSWETWISVVDVPGDDAIEKVLTLGRIRLSTGEVIESIPNNDVPEVGFVPGDPRV